MKKKIIVLLIAVVMISASVISCTVAPTSGTQPPTSTPYIPNYEFNLPAAGAYDFGGKTITVCSYHGQSFEQREDFMRRYSMNGQMENLYNVKIAYTTDLASAQSAAIAGAPTADIAYLMPHQLTQWITGGIAEPLDSYTAELKLDDPRWDQTLLNWTKINGKQYAVGTVPEELWKYHFVLAMFMNKDLLKSCNINPDDLYAKQESKQWTWDEFSKVASQVTRDLNGDDTPDIYGTTVGGLNIFESFMVSNQTNIIKQKDDGTFTFSADTKVIEVMNFLNSLLRNNASRGTEAMTGINTNQDDTDFINGKLGFNIQVFQRTWVSLNSMEDEYGVMCIPIAPSATDYYFTDGGYTVYSMFAQPDKEWAKKIAQFIYVYNTPLFTTDEEEQECYWLEANNRIYDEGSKYFLERVYERTNVVRINNVMFTYAGMPFSIEPLFTDEKTAQQLIEEQTPACIEYINNLFKATP